MRLVDLPPGFEPPGRPLSSFDQALVALFTADHMRAVIRARGGRRLDAKDLVLLKEVIDHYMRLH